MKNKKIYIVLFIALFSFATIEALNNSNRKVYVDKEGVMRNSFTNEEVSYYGTNYTLPFAHAFRSVSNQNLDLKRVIDNDVNHFSRLGFNAFRLHIWDVEISDSIGNLISNQHLDLLDYLIYRLEQNGIDIILTAQTNFGNGYPERDINTGAFSYLYDKCDVHSNPKAQAAQERYLRDLMNHKNPYTKLKYSEDINIIGFEINNEPCHTAAKEDVKNYISRMAKAMRDENFDGIILYNVSHNGDVVSAYYDVPEITATTYQWYPDGLVSGHTRKGNYLPAVGHYNIPWKDTIPEFNSKARVVYEFDPGDLLYSYMYPAIAKTFRNAGFQWATQFAYDPTPIAEYNTEYQTHFLNLLYTPSKALSMAVAAEVMRSEPRKLNNDSFTDFSTDSIFGNFRVSYNNDLSEYNSPEKFIYSNSTTSLPSASRSLKHIWGKGNSPLIQTTATGAYFLDKLSTQSSNNIWRLELMPDVVITSDPFEKTSSHKSVANLYYIPNTLKVSLPQLNDNFYYVALSDSSLNNYYSKKLSQKEYNNLSQINKADDGNIDILPGVYLISNSEKELRKYIKENNIDSLKNYCGNPDFIPSINKGNNNQTIEIVNLTPSVIAEGDSLHISLDIFSNEEIADVTLYPEDISFWRNNNELYPLEKNRSHNFADNKNVKRYECIIPARKLNSQKRFKYNIAVGCTNGNQTTFPGKAEGNPLSWNYINEEMFETEIVNINDPVILLQPAEKDSKLDISTIPDDWRFKIDYNKNYPLKPDTYTIKRNKESDNMIILRRYLGDDPYLNTSLSNKKEIVVNMPDNEIIGNNIKIYLYTKEGKAWNIPLTNDNKEALVGNLKNIEPANALIVPAPFPTFLPREIENNNLDPNHFNIAEIEFVELRIYPANQQQQENIELSTIYLR